MKHYKSKLKLVKTFGLKEQKRSTPRDLTWNLMTCHKIFHNHHLPPHFVHYVNRQYLKGSTGK